MKHMSIKRRASTRRMRDIRPALNERCNGECERCGFPLDIQDDGTYVFDVHHRKQRSVGGKDVLENSLAVHHSCHVLHRKSIHEDVQQATVDGFLVASWADPERVVVLYKGILSWLNRDGTVRPVTRMYRLDPAEPVWDDEPGAVYALEADAQDRMDGVL